MSRGWGQHLGVHAEATLPRRFDCCPPAFMGRSLWKASAIGAGSCGIRNRASVYRGQWEIRPDLATSRERLPIPPLVSGCLRHAVNSPRHAVGRCFVPRAPLPKGLRQIRACQFSASALAAASRTLCSGLLEAGLSIPEQRLLRVRATS